VWQRLESVSVESEAGTQLGVATRTQAAAVAHRHNLMTEDR
jgi:hypothetical protein